MVWIIDCWNAHISEDFHNWIKNEHKYILLIFVPNNCTSELKPTNVILQKPLKHAFKVHFNSWIYRTIKDQIIGTKGRLQD
jgi:thioredoxin-related protein